MLPNQKTVLVTGASRGLGRAIALAFARRNYNVAIHYHVNKTEADKTLVLVDQMGGHGALMRADIGESSSCDKLIKTVIAEFGRIDVLVNNAGSVKNKLIAKMTDDDWREPFKTCLDGPFFLTRSVIPILREQKGGSIVNISSYAAPRGLRGAANYAAAKAGVIALTKTTAIEEGPFHIRANAVYPGFHVTEINEDVWKRFEADIRKQHLLPEMPDREEMADFVVKIAELKTVTGQVFAFESRLI